MSEAKGELKMRKVGDEILIVDVDGNIVANLTINQSIDYIQSVALPNGPRLVSCWNCHDELVEACESALSLLGNVDEDAIIAKAIQKQIKQALAKVNGGK